MAWWWRLTLFSVVGLAALPLAGCSSDQTSRPTGGQGTISTDEAVAALHEAGFADLVVHSNEEAMKEAARRLHKPELAEHPLDVDTIYPRGRWTAFVTLPIAAVRHHSVAGAERAYENGQAFREGEIPADVREALPPDFDPKRLREDRVCNVVIMSYDARTEPDLENRFRRAIDLLHDKCA
jgi:hypothetical protein